MDNDRVPLGSHREHPASAARALESLFRRKTIADLAQWLRGLGVPRRAREDLSQAILLSAFESFRSYDPRRGRPERWLNRIAVHHAAHYHERACHRREQLTSKVHRAEPDPRPLADAQLEGAQRRTFALELLQELPSCLRAIVVAHYLDEIAMAEIADMFGLPLSTAYKRRARALEILQETGRRLSRPPRGPRRRAAGGRFA
jgi:RNA polymerase sigma-70 factor, ECF subfamily